MANSTVNKTQAENTKSQLLYDDENALIFSLLGRKCCSLSTAVIQLLLSKPPDHLKWDVKCTGVVCFVKDNPKRSYFIRVYDFDRKMMVWEQELYTAFEYRRARPLFHTFEAHDCMAGLFFANHQEAQHFLDTVQDKLDNRKKKIQEKTKPDYKMHNSNNNINMPTHNIQPTSQGVSLSPEKYNLSKKSYKNDKSRKKKVSKNDIGIPTNFQHLQHIGYDSKTGSFLTTKIDDKLMEYLTASGISKELLKDESTVNFIHQFADSLGGMDKIVKEFERPAPPAIPTVPPVHLPKKSSNNTNNNSNYRNHHSQFPVPPPPPPLPSHSSSSSLHSMASGQQRKQNMAPSIPVTQLPPPPPPPPPSEPTMMANGLTNNSNSIGGAPPPPPPPPPPPSFTSSISNSNSNNSGAAQKNAVSSAPMSSNQALLEAIRKGTTLNHVDPNEVANKSSAVSSDDVRGQLFEQIRKGVGLRKVEPNSNRPELKSQSGTKIGGGGLADALARALQERSRALNQTDDSSNDDSNSDDDDEWDDRST